MAEVTINNSPFHVKSQITYPYAVEDSSYSCGYHTGIDIVSRGENNNLYPVENGVVVYKNNTTDVALGVQVQILGESGKYWRYCHMVLNSNNDIEVGQEVTKNTKIGEMGATGNVSGAHLHLECSTTQNWNCETFVNPCIEIGIPNEDNLIINYDRDITPEPPTPTTLYKKKKFPWVLYARKLRNKRSI